MIRFQDVQYAAVVLDGDRRGRTLIHHNDLQHLCHLIS